MLEVVATTPSSPLGVVDPVAVGIDLSLTPSIWMFEGAKPCTGRNIFYTLISLAFPSRADSGLRKPRQSPFEQISLKGLLPARSNCFLHILRQESNTKRPFLPLLRARFSLLTSRRRRRWMYNQPPRNDESSGLYAKTQANRPGAPFSEHNHRVLIENVRNTLNRGVKPLRQARSSAQSC